MSKKDTVSAVPYKVTLRDLRDGLNVAEEHGLNLDSAVILWTDQAREGDQYCKNVNVIPGTVMIGVDDAYEGKGTLRIEPKMISEMLS